MSAAINKDVLLWSYISHYHSGILTFFLYSSVLPHFYLCYTRALLCIISDNKLAASSIGVCGSLKSTPFSLEAQAFPLSVPHALYSIYNCSDSLLCMSISSGGNQYMEI